MSWDVVLMNQQGLPTSMAEAPPDFKPVPLGDAAEVRTRISAVLPQVDWSDPAWGTLQGDGYTIEFNTNAEGTVDDLMLHVRGDGDPLPAIANICHQNAWAALDMSTGDFLDPANPSRGGWNDFRDFREQIKSTIVARYYMRIALLVLALLSFAAGVAGRFLIPHRLLGSLALALGIAIAFFLYRAARRNPSEHLPPDA